MEYDRFRYVYERSEKILEKNLNRFVREIREYNKIAKKIRLKIIIDFRNSRNLTEG